MSNIAFVEKIAPMVQEVFCDSRGVNPSVVIAQAILESGYGTSKLSKYISLQYFTTLSTDKVTISDLTVPP